jgi:diaminopimelate epimerase
MALKFTKMHGTGNDFVVLDGMRKPVKLNAALSRALCDRHFGVGADQILILEPSKKADFRMRIVNADGSEVEMCGNGIRCAARYAFDRGYVRKKDMTVETLAGAIRPSLQKETVRVDMGAPILDAEKIPTRGKGRVIDAPFRWTGNEVRMTCVSMGNPHTVIFVDDLSKVPAAVWGPQIENHSFFPKRVNVEFAQVVSPGHVKVRVWERGAGLTMACGTGACAVAVAGVLTGRTQRKVRVSLPGGDLNVEWAADEHVYMTGAAAYVFQGEFESNGK